MKRTTIIIGLLVCLALGFHQASSGGPAVEANMQVDAAVETDMQVDVLVYGGTSAGVIAAYTAKMYGHSVLLVEPGRHLGGMTSGGLVQLQQVFWTMCCRRSQP